jgi:hypothetical protein
MPCGCANGPAGGAHTWDNALVGPHVEWDHELVGPCDGGTVVGPDLSFLFFSSCFVTIMSLFCGVKLLS